MKFLLPQTRHKRKGFSEERDDRVSYAILGGSPVASLPATFEGSGLSAVRPPNSESPIVGTMSDEPEIPVPPEPSTHVLKALLAQKERAINK